MVSSSLFFSQLDNNGSALSLELKMSLEKRVRERIQNNIFGVIKYLHDPESILEENIYFVPQKSSIQKTIKSLFVDCTQNWKTMIYMRN